MYLFWKPSPWLCVGCGVRKMRIYDSCHNYEGNRFYKWAFHQSQYWCFEECDIYVYTCFASDILLGVYCKSFSSRIDRFLLCSSNTSNEGSNETLAGACLTCAVESSTISEVVGIANYKHSYSCHGEVSMGRGGGGGEGGGREEEVWVYVDRGWASFVQLQHVCPETVATCVLDVC